MSSRRDALTVAEKRLVSRVATESEPNRGRSNHAAWRACGEFAGDIFAKAAIRCTDSSPLRSATLTCARQCAPWSVHRICCFFAMRWPLRVINGDLMAKLREYKAQSEEPIPENVARFLAELQRVAA